MPSELAHRGKPNSFGYHSLICRSGHPLPNLAVHTALQCADSWCLCSTGVPAVYPLVAAVAGLEVPSIAENYTFPLGAVYKFVGLYDAA